MDKQNVVFTILKPLDFGMGMILGVLKKVNLFETASNLTYQGLKKALKTQYTLLNHLTVEGSENVPEEGGVIFALNHQSWADVQVFGSTCPRRVHFVAKAMFKKWPILRHLIDLNQGIYVHRSPNSKEQTSGELNSIVDQLKDGKTVCIFPEGTIPGEENIPRHAVEPKTGLLKGRSGVVRLALEAQVPIVPVGISGTGRAFPPEIYPRLELLRLPDTTPMKVRYGKPIDYEEYYGQDLTGTAKGRKKIRELTDALMMKISDLVDHQMHYIPQEVPIAPLPQFDKIGVLLLHGFTSSLDTVNGLVPHLKKAGIAYEMPVLRGHCANYKDMTGTTAKDWYADAEKALLKLKKKVDQVVVVGLSMGGLVALELGINHPDKIAGVETVAAALRFTDPLAGLSPLLSRVVKYWPSPNSFHDKELAKKNTNYKKFATDAFASLYAYSTEIEAKLPELTVPIRILQSKKDQIVAPVSANHIYEKVASKIREIVWFDQSGHEMMMDMEAPKVFTSLMEFILRYQKDAVVESTVETKLADEIAA